jgi:hypothetical protein
MKFQLAGLVRMKPFDESTDATRADAVYGKTSVLSVGVIMSALLSLVALFLALVHAAFAFPAVGLAVAVSALTAGLEWNAGLKARAANQLFATVLFAGGIALINRL